MRKFNIMCLSENKQGEISVKAADIARPTGTHFNCPTCNERIVIRTGILRVVIIGDPVNHRHNEIRG